MKIRNIAIIAHVDHGKTTLVDALLRHSQTDLEKDQNQNELIMDNNELERERGITIFSKNASIIWKNTKINIIDTPGHADFGGEVERVLKMADGCLLLVDAKEGPLPQTRFVLKNALALGLKVILVINKIDKPDARPDFALNKTFDLFIDLGADDDSSDFETIYASAKNGVAGDSPDISKMTDISPVLDKILDIIPEPSGDASKPLQIMITNFYKDNYKGKIITGRIYNGKIENKSEVLLWTKEDKQKNCRISSLIGFEGLSKKEIQSAIAGDIVGIAGIEDANIGDTITDPENPEKLDPIHIEEPTVKMTFMVNDSPMAGREGEYSTSRQIDARLKKELETDVALKVEPNSDGSWNVSGRGELHLAILIERMRREGYELQVSKAKVVEKIIDGKKMTPFEQVFIEVPEKHSGNVIQSLGQRGGEMTSMNIENSICFLEFIIPTKGLLGYRSEFITETRGLGIINTSFLEYRADSSKWKDKSKGSLIAHESGKTTAYGLSNAQVRGKLFISPNEDIYKGQVVGKNSRNEDLIVNVCKGKALTNMRSSNSDGLIQLDVPKKLTLEESIEYISDDELIEITPKNIRIRKKYLSESERKRHSRKK